MRECRYYGAIIVNRGLNGDFGAVFHDFGDFSILPSTDFDRVISNAGNFLASYLRQEGADSNQTPLYKIPMRTDEFRRVLISIEFDVEFNAVNYNGFLCLNNNDTGQEGLWDNPHNLSETLFGGIHASDDYRSFNFFRNLMGLTNQVKVKIYGHIDDKYKDKNRLSSFGKDANLKTSVDVFNRLLLRYAILRDVEKLEHRYAVQSTYFQSEMVDSQSPSRTLENIYNNSGDVTDDKIIDNDRGKKTTSHVNPAVRAYRFATTDMFVEKAIIHLERSSFLYRVIGMILFIIATGVITYGVSIAQAVFFSEKQVPIVTGWAGFLTFSKAFTFYGMIVLLAVVLWRLGKAMLDQAERLLDRRHALRQGRLFVHLNDGELDLNGLEKAFAWNVNNGNAFGNIPTEASAPWGGLFKDVIQVVTDRLNKKG
jgi:hypothetical protein